MCSQRGWPRALSETLQDEASLETRIYMGATEAFKTESPSTLYFSMKPLLHYDRVVAPVIDLDISVSDRVILEPHQVEM